MSKDIRIKKGLDIRLVGAAEETIVEASHPKTVTLRPSDFHLITPKLVVKEGAKLKAGDEIFYSKTQEAIRFVAPVSGTLTAIKRGAKRVITDLVIATDAKISYKDFGTLDAESASAEAIKEKLLTAGLWPFIKQRPYDVIANPEGQPKAIFISAYASAPLAPNYDLVLAAKEKELQAAITALGKLTAGAIHIAVAKSGNSPLATITGAQLHKVSGPHPSGNVGTLINKVDPINKGEVAWTVSPQDLVVIGELFLTGKFNASRVISVAGAAIENPKYYNTLIGASVSSFCQDAGIKDDTRLISGNVLTGKKIGTEGALGYYDNEIVSIPEGDDYEFFGWNKPVFNKISPTRALTFSWLNPKKKYNLDTNTNGEHRAFVVTGSYEEVFPLDMYPLQLLKACMVEDLDQMEALGMYEVAPEDFALTEFICVSKQPHQDIIRKGLDVMYKEIG